MEFGAGGIGRIELLLCSFKDTETVPLEIPGARNIEGGSWNRRLSLSKTRRAEDVGAQQGEALQGSCGKGSWSLNPDWGRRKCGHACRQKPTELRNEAETEVGREG